VDRELTVSAEHLPTLLAHRTRHMGQQPNVVPTDREHSSFYVSEFCRQPVIKYNPPEHPYLLHPGAWAQHVHSTRRFSA
jgi:hypothetical protein